MYSKAVKERSVDVVSPTRPGKELPLPSKETKNLDPAACSCSIHPLPGCGPIPRRKSAPSPGADRPPPIGRPGARTGSRRPRQLRGKGDPFQYFRVRGGGAGGDLGHPHVPLELIPPQLRNQGDDAALRKAVIAHQPRGEGGRIVQVPRTVRGGAVPGTKHHLLRCSSGEQHLDLFQEPRPSDGRVRIVRAVHEHRPGPVLPPRNHADPPYFFHAVLPHAENRSRDRHPSLVHRQPVHHS
eukprot:scaffold492_cov341-Pavlova_lutheri.AAC.3